MTIKQWLWHFRMWLRMFPLLRRDDHLWMGLVYSGKYDCCCGATMFDPEDEDKEAYNSMMAEDENELEEDGD